MKKQHRVIMVSLCTALVLMLGGCAPKAPMIGTVPSADQVAIQYETVGRGDTALVFVHCWTCNRSEWDKQAEYFSGKYQVVRLDLAGHGGSGRERKDYTIEAFAADVTTVVDQLGLKRAVLIGSSMGGPVAVEAAGRLGNRAIGVVGVDSFYTGFEVPKDPKKFEAMKRGFLKPFEENYPVAAANFIRGFFAPGAEPKLVERIASGTAATDKTMALSAMRNIFAWHHRNTPATLDALGPRLRNINANPKSDRQPLHASVVLVAGRRAFHPGGKTGRV